jgi:hypothetical protein
VHRLKCGKRCAGYDARRWRHLDTCQCQTYAMAELRSCFTALLEAVVIDWLKEASFAVVARRHGLSRDEVDGITV